MSFPPYRRFKSNTTQKMNINFKHECNRVRYLYKIKLIMEADFEGVVRIVDYHTYEFTILVK